MWDMIKRFLKERLLLRYRGDGTFYIYVRFPIRINSAIKYRLLYANRPIQPDKIVFDNYMGKGYGGNPKYIAEKILEQYPGRYDLVWLVSEEELEKSDFPEGVRPVIYQSSKAYQEYATAKMWISNYHKIAYIKKGMRKREGQYFVQTWHGSLGIKRIEKDVPFLRENVNWYEMAKLSSSMVDLWISNSRWETEIYKRAFWDVKNVFEAGHPRNDVLYAEASLRATKKVRAYFHLGDERILFYAPTFRADYRLDCYRIDYAAVRAALEDRFGGKWVILVRLHPRVRQYAPMSIPKETFVKDATSYVDIQELVAAADAMLTDYSSCIFDFLLTRRPGFLFAPDEEEYTQERGFYYPLEDTPFPVSHTCGELVRQIGAFDEKRYRQDAEEFLEDKGCIEDGHASERVVQKIVEVMENRESKER